MGLYGENFRAGRIQFGVHSGRVIGSRSSEQLLALSSAGQHLEPESRGRLPRPKGGHMDGLACGRP
jgi:hypothetical protein